MSTRVAIAVGAITVLGLLIFRVGRRRDAVPGALAPRAEPDRATAAPAAPAAAPTGPADDFEILIQTLDAGNCEWISSPVRLGNRLAITIGNGATHSYTFSPTDDRLVRLRQAVDRNHVLAPHGSGVK